MAYMNPHSTSVFSVIVSLFMVTIAHSESIIFDPPLVFAGVDVAANRTLVKDVNLDGFPDLITFNSTSAVSVWMNNTQGGVYGPSDYDLQPIQFSPFNSIALGDLDGDGFPELIAARAGSGTAGPGVIAVLPNLGDGTFGTKLEFEVLPPVTPFQKLTPTSLVAADLDGDGDDDLAVSTVMLNDDETPSFFSIIRNLTKPEGPIVLASSFNYPTAEKFALSIVAADLDNDGDLDLASANRQSDTVSVILNAGNGIFAAEHSETISGGSIGPKQLCAGDINGDGFLDLIVITNVHTFAVLMNLDGGKNVDNAGQFRYLAQFPVGPGIGPLTGLTMADLDQDGDQDLVITMTGTPAGSVVILPNDGIGNFPTQIITADNRDYFDVIAVDMDGDQDMDLISGNGSPVRVTILKNAAIDNSPDGDVNGDGVVTIDDVIDLLAVWGPCTTPCAADMNNDGTVGIGDLLVVLAAWS